MSHFAEAWYEHSCEPVLQDQVVLSYSKAERKMDTFFCVFCWQQIGDVGTVLGVMPAPEEVLFIAIAGTRTKPF